MLWQSNRGLDQLPISFRFSLTAFLLVCGLGYLLGVANIWFSYTPVDGKPGLSIDDIRIAFHGDPSGSKLEKALGGSMKQYLSSDGDGQKIVAWIRAGGTEATFTTVQPIFDTSCNSCHSADVATAGIVTANFKNIQPLLESDSGKSWSRLAALSHTHVNALLPLMFCLSIIFSFTRFSDRLKGVVMVFSFISFTFDVFVWWIAKIFAWAAPLVIVGGATLGVAYMLLLLLPLEELWIKKIHFLLEKPKQK
ncbi:MAG: hypothetical protein WCL50_00640 [Spirochaetota bacterium]